MFLNPKDRKLLMNKSQNFFAILLVIGMILMLGRIIIGILAYFDITFISFFADYSVESFVILLIGVLGELMTRKRIR